MLILVSVLKVIGSIVFGIIAIEKINHIFNDENWDYSEGTAWIENNANTVIRF